MELEEIKRRASSLGIDPGGLSLTELVRYIQIKENNRPCFGRHLVNIGCDTCCFHRSCFNVIPLITFNVV